MFVLGITGGIGSGKSTVSSLLSEKGLTVLDADKISHDVTMPGGIAIEEIAESFGRRAISPDGAMNRKYVSSQVFSDKKKLDELSSIIHRRVFEYIDSAIEKARNAGVKCIVLDVPLPVKRGFVDNCNQIWVVTCDENIRLSRLVERGMTIDEAKRRIMVQMTDDEYREIGDFEIDNSGDITELKEKVDLLVIKELHERGIRV